MPITDIHRLTALSLFASLAACSDHVEIDGVDGLPIDDIAFSFNARDSGGNAAGGTTTATTIVLTDRENLCDEATEAGGLDAMSDVFAVQIFALSTGDPNTIDSNASLFDVLFTTTGTGQAVASRILHRSGGETLFDGFSVNLLDLESTTPGEFAINSVSSSPNGTSFGGTFETRLGGERSDPTNWDTDATDDGEFDYRAISGTVSGRFTGAKGCDALRSYVEVPDVDPDVDPDDECADETFDNPNPSGGGLFVTEFGEVCAGGQDRMTYNVDTGCTTRLDVNVPDAFGDNGTQVRDVDVGLFFAGGGGSSPTGHSIREENEFGDLRIYVENGGDSLGAVTVRISHRAGEDPVPYTLNTVVDCP